MKTPGWAIFVGIMMILIGGCGVLSDVQAIYSPKLLGMNQDFLEGLEEDRKRDSLDIGETEMSEESKPSLTDNTGLKVVIESDSTNIDFDTDKDEVPEKIKDLLKISDHYKTWIVRFGYIGLLFSLMYILSGFFMIAKQRFSLKLAYITLGSCILFSLVQIFVLTMGEKNMFTIASSASAGGGIFLDLIFLVIITACDTTVYEPESFS